MTQPPDQRPLRPAFARTTILGRLLTGSAITRLLLTAAVTYCSAGASAADWPGFRGAAGRSAVPEARLPLSWSNTENLIWQADLPGPGASSPIIVAERVFITCYSGYGIYGKPKGKPADLVRHILCFNRQTGELLWSKTNPNKATEDPYSGYLTEHGYASSTPVCDGERVYAFFGKSGVFAWDLTGKQLWNTGVGTKSSNRAWGSGSSLVVSPSALFVNASDESQAVYALDPQTGKQIWKSDGPPINLSYGTPALVKTNLGGPQLIVCAPELLIALDPATGKRQWTVPHSLTGNISPSVVADGANLYLFGGFQSAGSLAVKIGPDGLADKKSIQWTSRSSSYVATPLLHAGRLYWIDDQGQAHAADAATGKQVYRQRVPNLDTSGRPVYASPVLGGERIYVPTRWNGVIVYAPGDKYEELARNRFADDESSFNATPAICDDRLFLRSNRRLYCVGLQSK